MNNKANTYEAVKAVASGAFWDEKNAEMIHPDFTLNYPSAPPGMPQYMDKYDAKLFLSWMRCTVRSWTVQLEEFFDCPDPNMFFAVGICDGEVYWGKHNGTYHSKFIMKILLEDKKIRHIKMMMDPLDFIRAAGREVPIFHMDLKSPLVAEYLRNPGPDDFKIVETEGLDTSAEAIAARREKNLKYFLGAEDGETACSPDFYNPVWFLPPEMKSTYPPEEMEVVMAWSMVSSPTLDYDPDGKFFPTSDPNVWFAEVGLTSHVNWLGNNCEGEYRNRYFYLIRFDEYGRLASSEEFMNPINKFNSINVSIPSFPYFV